MSLSKYNTTTKELEPIAGGFDVQGILDDIGDLTDLDTSTKTDLVSAVNEVKGDIPTKTSDLTNNSGFVGLGETSSTAYAGDKGKANAGAIEAIVNVNGAKNLLPNQSADGTENGLTFTKNADGSITVNGTATATTNHIIYYTESTPDILLNRNLIFSGCTGGTQQGTYRLWMGDKNWSGIVECTDGDSLFNISQNKGILCIIQVVSGVTMNNVTFYPMIRDARITDPTYVPYAMTNKKLTEITNLLLSQTKFIGTLDGDVLARAKSMPVGCVYFYGNSNAPANAPSGCEWGSYIMYKSGNNTSILYLDNAHIASAYGINDNSTSIDWHIV